MNSACAGPEGARPWDGPSNGERSESIPPSPPYSKKSLYASTGFFFALRVFYRPFFGHAASMDTEFAPQGQLEREFLDLLYYGYRNHRRLTIMNNSRNQVERYEYFLRRLLSETSLSRMSPRVFLQSASNETPKRHELRYFQARFSIARKNTSSVNRTLPCAPLR